MIKVKTPKIKKTDFDDLKKDPAEYLSAMFNGSDSGDTSYLVEKYKKMNGALEKILKIYNIFVGTLMSNDYFATYKKEFVAHVEKLTAAYRDLIADVKKEERDAVLNAKKEKLTKSGKNADLITAESISDLDVYVARYTICKNHAEVKQIILMCDRISLLKSCFENKDQSGNYKLERLMTDTTMDFCPFEFCAINIRSMFLLGNLSDKEHQIFFSILNKLYDQSYIVFDLITSPDIDPGVLSEIITSSLKSLRNHPKLHKCKEAFDKIQESTGLLKDNLKNYYRDFLRTQNQTTIFENFILDIVKDNKKNNSKGINKVAMQFQTIIKVIRENQQMSGKKKNPAHEKLFAVLDKLNNLNKKESVESELDPDEIKEEIL